MDDMNNIDLIKEEEKENNINKIIEKTMDNVIEQFSGKDLQVSTKIIDNVVSFIGAAGGTGTSTIVANLAYNLVKRGMRVLVVDMNIMYPIQHSFFGIDQSLDKKDLVSFVLGSNQLGESVDNRGDLAVMFANNRYLMDHINCDCSSAAETITEAIKRVKHLFDMIIFDVPRTIEFDLVNTVLYNSDIIYTVWDENIECISNIDRMRKNMMVCGIESYARVKAIMSKKTSIYYTESVFKELEIELIEVLPFDVAIIESGLRGEVFCEKGASVSKNAAIFVERMKSLTDKILRIGGYGDGQ